MNRKVVFAAVIAAVGMSGAAFGDAPAPDVVTPYNLMDVAPRQVQVRPLMHTIDRNDSFYKATGIDIYGHVEGGYTYNFNNPSNGQNAFRSFDFEDQELILDQIDLAIERKVDYRKNQFDVGFLIEWIYGADAGLIHANGVFDWYDGPRNPENQFDPVQFYVDIAVPVLNGSRVRVGKFANLVGFESINPTVDFIGFYSRSFVFGSGYPFTHTGALFTTDICKDVTITAGVTRGDEQSFKDNNSAVAFLGSLNWVINKQMALYIANSTGPEQPNDNSHYRTTWDATFYWQPTDKCRFLANGYFLWDGAGAADGDSGYLYSFALLGSYQACKECVIKLRGEYFHDEDGLRTPPDTNLYEITVGLDVIPFAGDPIGKNFIVRPEFRFDFSDDKVFDGDKEQFTFGVDAIFKF
jgi:hypothetical protein